MENKKLYPLGLLLSLVALLLLNGCASLAGKKPEDVLKKAANLLAAGSVEEAVDLTDLAREEWPDSLEATILWVYAAKESALGSRPVNFDLLNEVETVCQELAEREINKVEPWFALGLVRGDRGDLDGAIAAWEEALRLEAFHKRTLKALASLHYSLGHERAAGKLYGRLRRIPLPDEKARPEMAEVLYRLGVCRLAEEEAKPRAKDCDYGRVQACFKAALDMEKEHLGALRGLTWLTLAEARRNGNWQDVKGRQDALARALGFIDRALKVAPQDPLCRHEHACLMEECGRLVAAEKIYREIIESNPDYAPSLVNLAAILATKDGFRGEVEELRRRAIAATDDPLLERALRKTLRPTGK